MLIFISYFSQRFANFVLIEVLYMKDLNKCLKFILPFCPFQLYQKVFVSSSAVLTRSLWEASQVGSLSQYNLDTAFHPGILPFLSLLPRSWAPKWLSCFRSKTISSSARIQRQTIMLHKCQIIVTIGSEKVTWN